jgi:ribonuclease VapC
MTGESGDDLQRCVLDASALLAMLQGEPGGESVEKILAKAVMSSVNWSEVLQKAMEQQTQVEGLRQDLEALGLTILPFTAEHAESTARLRPQTRHVGLSLGDRACLALAADLRLPAITVDRIWKQADLGIEVQLVR